MITIALKGRILRIKSNIPLFSEKLIDDFEYYAEYRFPTEFKNSLLTLNGASIYEDSFPFKGNILSFRYFLSMNKRDDESFWNYFDLIYSNKINRRECRKLIPFAVDEFGNSYCFDKITNEIKFLDHENYVVIKLSDNFQDFVKNLTDLE